jgi:hypothetical protein
VPGATYDVTMFSDPIKLGTVTADANGAFSFTASLPVGLTGNHRIVVTGPGLDGTGVSLEQPIAIPATTAPEELAFTGPRTAWIALTGIALVALGITILRRRTT